MKDFSHIIPTGKEDDDFIGNLRKYTVSEIKEYIPQLLEWLQDGNWPQSKPIRDYLIPQINEIDDDIVAIFATDDGTWKYWIISMLHSCDVFPLSQKIVQAVKRVAENPTQDEILEQAQEEAIELIEYYNSKTSS